MDEILNLIESVSEGFPSYSCKSFIHNAFFAKVFAYLLRCKNKRLNNLLLTGALKRTFCLCVNIYNNANRVRSFFISLMNTKIGIFTRGFANRENTAFVVHSVK